MSVSKLDREQLPPAEMFHSIPESRHVQVDRTLDFTAPEGWNLRIPRTSPYVLKLYRSGKSRYRIDGHEFEMFRGRLLLVSPGCEVSAGPDAGNRPEKIVILFRLHENFGGAQSPNPPAPFHRIADAVDYASVLPAFLQLHAYTSMPNPAAFRGICQSLLYRLLFEHFLFPQPAQRAQAAAEDVRRELDRNPGLRPSAAKEGECPKNPVPSSSWVIP